MKKAKTLLEAATDILLNRSEVSEAKKDLKQIFETLEGAIRDLEEQGDYIKAGDSQKYAKLIDNLFSEAADLRQLCELNGMIKEADCEDEEELEEGTEELDDIAAKVATLKVGDKTNFGQVVSIGGNSVTFKSKDLPKTTIAFKQRKMGSRDYVLTALRKLN